MSNADTRAEIAAIIRSIFVSFQEQRPDVIETHMWSEATIWDVFTPELIQGRAERDRFHQDDQAQMQARGPLTLTLEEPVVTSWDDTAIARYCLEFRYDPPNAAAGRVRITDVFRRMEGRWQVVHHHEGMVPEGAPPVDEARI